MTLTITLDLSGQLSINEMPIGDFQALESYLALHATRTPQPELTFQPDRPDNYGAIGKMIYMIRRLGFTNDVTIVMSGGPMSTSP